MNGFIFGLHCALVFGVPVFFGWVVLRRAVREHDLATLLPGSMVVGFAGLMALVNELRYWLEFGPAVWFAYKALLLAALILLISTRPARRSLGWRRDARAPGKILLALTVAAMMGVYFGIPASAGFLNDAWWGHLPLAVQIQTTEHFPLAHPFAVDDRLYYHIGPDILAASWAHLLDMSVARGFALNIIFFAPATFLLAFALALRISRHFWSSLTAGCLLLLGGNLRFFNLLGANLGNPAARLQIFNSQTIQGLLQMVFTPSHAVGIPFSLLTLLLLRTFLGRPSWPLAAVLGLLLGAISLVAEWYFYPLFAVIALCLALRARRLDLRCQAGRNRLAVLVGVLLIAGTYSFYNNTYLASMFGNFWMRYPSLNEHAYSRQVSGAIEQNRVRFVMRDNQEVESETTNSQPSSAKIPISVANGGTIPLPPTTDVTRHPSPGPTVRPQLSPQIATIRRYSPPAMLVSPYSPTPFNPVLLPLHLNTRHLGYVPSWQDAGSSSGSWVPFWSWSFLAEFFPVVGLGLPFGVWLWRRTRDPLLLALLLIIALSVVPPILLDWDYRSTDFLRFFTGAFSFSALLLGLMIGRLVRSLKPNLRLIGWALALGGLANAAGLGLLGLVPSTLASAKLVSAGGMSLAQAASSAASTTATSANHDAAFLELAQDLDRFLFPITKGRDRAIVIVPPDLIPPLKIFPEWMKLATLSRLLLPTGWHWTDSLYAAYYRQAASTLDQRALDCLGARWVIVTNLWDEQPPAAVVQALEDRNRFVPASTFFAGPYYLSVYRIY